MSTELVKVQYGPSELAKGVGFNSKYLQVKPDRITLVQPTTTADGAIPGKLRIGSTGEQFSEMRLVALFEPVDRRNYYEGEGFSGDNLVCFSQDCVRPHPRSKILQAEYCDMCPRASWEKYEQSHRREDLPPCKKFLHNLVVERQTKLPYYLDVYSTSRSPFLRGLQTIARGMALLKSQGKIPNIFDFSFTLTSKKVPGAAYYVLDIKDVKGMNDDERAEFGELYLKMANAISSQRSVTETEEAETEPSFTDGAEEVAI
jgi:hypothetical protein